MQAGEIHRHERYPALYSQKTRPESVRAKLYTVETMPKCPSGRGLSPRVRRYRHHSPERRPVAGSISTCAEVHCDTLSGRGHQSAGKRTACLEKCNRYRAYRPTHVRAALHEPTEGRYRGWVSTVRRRSFTCWSTSSTSIGTSSAMGTTSRMRRALRLYVK